MRIKLNTSKTPALQPLHPQHLRHNRLQYQYSESPCTRRSIGTLVEQVADIFCVRRSHVRGRSCAVARLAYSSYNHRSHPWVLFITIYNTGCLSMRQALQGAAFLARWYIILQHLDTRIINPCSSILYTFPAEPCTI